MPKAKKPVEECVLLDRERKTGILTINRPDVLNCIDLKTMVKLNEIILDLKKDKSVRVLIIRGAGDRAFSTGIDLKAPMSTEETEKLRNLGRITVYELKELPQIVIASMSGYVLGGGLELSLAADFRIASEGAQFGFQRDVLITTLPTWGGLVLLPRIVGPVHAKSLIHTGELIGAEWAKTIGLVHEVVPNDDLDLFVMSFAKEMSKRSPFLVKLTHLAINYSSDLGLKDALKLEKTIFDLAKSKEVGEREERYQELWRKLNRSKLDI